MTSFLDEQNIIFTSSKPGKSKWARGEHGRGVSMNNGAPNGYASSSGENPCKSCFLMLDNSSFIARKESQNKNKSGQCFVSLCLLSKNFKDTFASFTCLRNLLFKLKTASKIKQRHNQAIHSLINQFSSTSTVIHSNQPQLEIGSPKQMM